MENNVRFARNIFMIAGIYGLIVMLPQYFLEERIGIDSPPAITHPEMFYGFVGVTTAWQILFLLLARDPVRFRPMMIAAIVEKISFPPAVVILYMQSRVSAMMLPFAAIDAILAVLFFWSFRITAERSQ